MVAQNWSFLTFSQVFAQYQAATDNVETQSPQQLTMAQLAQARIKAEGEWFAAIASLQSLLFPIIKQNQSNIQDYQGLILAAPTPVLSNRHLCHHLYTGIFTPKTVTPLQLPAANMTKAEVIECNGLEIPLFPQDPLNQEQFCLVLTPYFSLAMFLGLNHDHCPVFQFSFEPELILQLWVNLRSRIALSQHHQLQDLESLFEQFRPIAPDYRIVTNFSRQLLHHLPETTPIRSIETITTETCVNKITTPSLTVEVKPSPSQTKSNPEIELLQALTHEIRTPLTTIRTLTRLLLKKRSNLSADITKRLELIDQECSEQIDRMELIFRAVEFETKSSPYQQLQLIPICLEQLLQQSIPRWQKQAQRRNVILDVILPQKLPKIVSDPAMLDQVLTGLMENFTRSLPTGGQIRVQVTTAGNQLKLQVQSQSHASSNPFKSLGHLLIFQPETGSLSLNLDVTKNLFQAIGGKLTVRQRHPQGEILTIFLPLGAKQQ